MDDKGSLVGIRVELGGGLLVGSMIPSMEVGKGAKERWFLLFFGVVFCLFVFGFVYLFASM